MLLSSVKNASDRRDLDVFTRTRYYVKVMYCVSYNVASMCLYYKQVIYYLCCWCIGLRLNV